MPSYVLPERSFHAGAHIERQSKYLPLPLFTPPILIIHLSNVCTPFPGSPPHPPSHSIALATTSSVASVVIDHDIIGRE